MSFCVVQYFVSFLTIHLIKHQHSAAYNTYVVYNYSVEVRGQKVMIK